MLSPKYIHVKNGNTIRPADDAINLAVKSIDAALRRDLASGDGVNVVVIDKDGAKYLKEEEIKKILK